MSATLIIPAPAKINLYLHIKNRLDTGYHNIESFIIFINLFDIITIKDSTYDSINIISSLGNKLKQLSNKENNLVFKIIDYIKKKYNIQKCIDVTLNKNIPIGAGLAGGSTNAAAILKALNRFWHLNLSKNELAKIAIKFGADIPSCIHNKSGIIEGIGDKYTSIPLNYQLHILLVSNLPSLNTKEVYTHFKYKINNEKNVFLPEKIHNKIDFLNYLRTQTNDLTQPAIKLLPLLKNVLKDLNKTNPIYARITGSGSSCFAIYSTTQQLQEAINKMQILYPDYLIIKVTNLNN